MIINELELKNIRSHINTIINFGNGITVISGRTGCGKSTVFMAVNYSLFGADTNLTNNSLLRRGAKTGQVRLKFVNNGVEYEVMRGMKRSGERIITDPDNLWVKANGILLPIISRSNEVNDKILELLNYPGEAKPKELFEVTCYAKQDEIRKLIELSVGEREKYIDRVLQLSKYELTYENMRPLLNRVDNELSLLKGRTENIDSVRNEIVEKIVIINDLTKSIKTVSDELIVSDESLKKVKSEYELINNNLRLLESKKASYDRCKGLIDGLTDEANLLEKEINESVMPEELMLEPLIARQAELLAEQSVIKRQVIAFEQEVNNIKSLKGNCPLCRQEVSESHVSVVVNELLIRVNELRHRSELIVSELSKLKERIIIEQSNKKLIDNFKHKKERVIEARVKIDNLTNNLVSYDEQGLSLLKNEFSQVNELYIKESGNNGLLKEKKRNLDFNLSTNNNVLANLKLELSKLEASVKDSMELEVKKKLLTRLRDDIRGIRNVIRTNFLEDFRHEFQRKYEDIRKDDSYSVEINNNYEPLAYAGSDETNINALSGGEKTSVALAYRLALSEIAAKVSSIQHSELLMLDEPTTGFDRSDINQLPQALMAVKTIPQIIIVSHEEELKEAADVNYEMEKKNGITIIN
ncbi:MAG: AAA family ATPase [Candidatus Nanoarchaeia archaeon]|jgi:exonuclease SbcC